MMQVDTKRGAPGTVRWQPDARGRLQAAALDRFTARGFDGTTVAEIAATAGLTERTFFRCSADKREVLFLGQDELLGLFVDGLRGALPGRPMAMVTAALAGAAAFFPEERRAWSRARQVVVDAEPSLQERELLELSLLAVAMTRALQERGVDPDAAALSAESGVAVFRVAFARWIAPGETRPLGELQHVVLGELRSLLGPA